MAKRSRIYIDTSVFGGCFDEEFAEASLALFEQIKAGKFILVISSILGRELDPAPAEVQQILDDLSSEMVESIPDAPEIVQLRDAYLAAGVVGTASKADAEHIAAASVAEVDFVVSWNFKHIVNYERINGYQAVNLLNGYKPINIYSPREVVN